MHMERTKLSNKMKVGLGITAVLALLYWSELIFSSAASLTRISETAVTLGWSAGATTGYFVLLALLDLVGGLAAVGFIWAAVKRHEWQSSIGRVLLITTFSYAAYQFAIAFFLPAELRGLYIGIGLVYLALAGAISWLTSSS